MWLLLCGVAAVSAGYVGLKELGVCGGLRDLEIMGCSVSLACSPPPLCDTKGCGCTILPVPLSQLRGFGWRESLLWYSHVLQLALEARCCLQIISLHCCPV